MKLHCLIPSWAKTTIPLLFCFFILLLPVFSFGQGTDSPRSRDAGGDISGWVEGPDGNITEGEVELRQDGVYIRAFWDLQPLGDFYFNDVPPGTFQLVFMDFSEIPMSDVYEVEVVSNRTSNVVIYVPFTVSGMPCDEKLDMGLDGYFDFVYGLLDENSGGFGFLSEMGMDRVALMYGECKTIENDELIEMLPETDQELVVDLRLALEDYCWAYYAVTFFMGTGATHFPTRSIAWREEFIEDVIMSIRKPVQVSEAEVSEAMDILDQLEFAVDYEYEPWGDEESETLYYETLDEYYLILENLNEIVLELPDDILVMVGEYIEI